MEPSCVRQTSIPGTSRLFADFLYNFEGVSRFFPSWFGDPEAITQAAAQVDFPEQRRAALVTALREQNGDLPSLKKLAEPGTVTVMTGQQVGLFSGPAYTIYKALTAARIAEHLTSRGIKAVPVFWLATEDHDLAEVDHAWVFDRHTIPRKLRFTETSETGGPVGNAIPGDVPLDQLSDAIGAFPHGADVVDRLRDAYRPGATLGGAFQAFLQPLLEDYGLLFVDPLAPGIREIVTPFLASAAQRIPELVCDLQARDRELAAAGYHSQVKIEGDSSLLFGIEHGKRVPIRWDGERFVLRGERRLTPAELTGNGIVLSPNALLRPVMEDYLLPTVAYVGGPAEIAYMAQAEVLYRKLLGRMPVLYPRNGFTLLDARAAKILDRYQLHVPDLLECPNAVRERIANKLVPGSLAEEIAKLRLSVDSSLQRLQQNLRSFDPTLEASAKKSATKMVYQLDKLSRKTARETLRRDARAADDAGYITNLIYPERHLQERFYSIVPFLAQHGLDLPRRLWNETQLNCADHMVRMV